MKTAWIFLLVTTHMGWVTHTTSSEARAFKTEIECNAALNEANKNRDKYDGMRAQCESVDAMLSEQYKEK